MLLSFHYETKIASIFIFTDCFILGFIKRILVGSELTVAFMMFLTVFNAIIDSLKVPQFVHVLIH